MNSLSYTGRDAVDIRRRLVDIVPEITDKWKDFNESDLGMTIIEIISGAQDMQNFYFDAQTFETYLDTAVQEKNIRAILRSMNYRMPLVVSARGELHIEFNQEIPGYFVIPKFTQFSCSTLDNVFYVAYDRYVVSKGSTFMDIPVIEGVVKTIKITKKDVLSNVTTNGKPSRRIYLKDKDVADRSVEIIQEGAIWEECDDALLKYNGGRYYSVHKDSNGEVYVLMSVNFTQLFPADEDEEITINYIHSKGLDGEVEAYKIDSIYSIIDNVNWISKIYNKLNTYGAADEPNLQKAKILAREQAQTLDRYITLNDYGNGVATEPYVMYSVVKDWKTMDIVQSPFTVYVWAVDNRGNNLGADNRKTLANKFKNKGVSAVSIEYQDTEFIYFDVSVKLVLRPVTETEKLDICGKVEEYLKRVFDVSVIPYGGKMSVSLLTSAIYTVSQYIKSVEVLNPLDDIIASDIQMLRLRNISVVADEEEEDV